VANLNNSQARVPGLRFESVPKSLANRGIANHLTVRTNAIDNEWNARQRSNPGAAGAAATDDGICCCADYVPGSRTIIPATVEGWRFGATEETPGAQHRDGEKKSGSAQRWLHRDARGYLTR
jgi:hypothetical protein